MRGYKYELITNLIQLNIYLCTFSSTCFGLICSSSGAMDVTISFSLHMQHMVSLVQLGVGLEECVCWWRVVLHCSWRWAYKPETCRAEST